MQLNSNNKMSKMKLDIKFEPVNKILSDNHIFMTFNKSVEESFAELSIGKYIKDAIKKLIRAGGKTSGPFTWGFWQRRKGQRNFQWVNAGSRPAISKGWKYGNASVLKYAVHPITYRYRRTFRKKPIPQQFALIDTGNTLVNMYWQNKKMKAGIIYSLLTSQHLLNAEYGIKQPKRKVLQPVYEDFQKQSKQKVEDYIAKKLEIKLQSEMRGL